MDDHIPETGATGFFQIIQQSVKGVGIGLILFLASFVVLWWNEGRIDVSEVARKSRPVNADTIDMAADGELVSVTGKLESEESLGDPGHLDFGPYIKLSRKAEIFAWVEHRSTVTEKNWGGEK